MIDINMKSGLCLAGVRLAVKSREELERFYTELLGMSVFHEDGRSNLYYEGSGAALILEQSLSESIYQHTRTDEYWKIGITLPNVDIAREQLINAGVEVSVAHQFRDIGYLCHLSDPQGFQIELLQHTFENEQCSLPVERRLPLGGGAQIGQITLRTNDIQSSLSHYCDDAGMKLISIQEVADLGFTLYFLAYTNESPPDANLRSVANRPWLYQRPYTTLEIQHVTDPEWVIISAPKGTGYVGLTNVATR